MRFCKVGVGCLAAALVFFGSLAVPLTALAQTPTEGFDLQISPLPIELNAMPGTSTSTQLRVRNAGSQDEQLQVRLLKVTEDDNGVVHLTQPGKGDTWANWVSFSHSLFDAPPNNWQTITMTINLPKSAAFGYCFAVEYTRANEAAPQPGQTMARGAVATFILLNAEAPGAVRTAQIVSFSADRKSYEFLPATFTVKIRATGNVYVAPHGNIFIIKGGKQIGSIQINTAEGNILPHSGRLFSSTWSDGFPVYVAKMNANNQPVMNKKGITEQTLKWDFSHANRLRFGHYTANLIMVYDNGQRDVPLQASVSFWIIPWRLVGAMLIVVIFVLIGLLSSFGRMSRFAKRLRRGGGGSKTEKAN